MGKTAPIMGFAAVKIYIIHGWTYNLDKWQVCSAQLKQAGIEPVLLRVPGLTTPSDKVWTIDDYVKWLREAVGDDTAPIVLGHSNGGRISLAYCNAYPGHMKQLLLLDSAGVPQTDILPRIKLAILRIVAKLGKPIAYIPLIRKIFYRLIGASDYNQAPPNMKLTMQNMLAADKTIDLSKVRVPTTIIWGKEDRVTPLRNAYTLQKGIIGAKLHIIDGARHSPMFTHPAQVTSLIKSALDEYHA